MSEFYIKNKIPDIFKKYKIRFEVAKDTLVLLDQDYTSIPNKIIVKMLGLKNDKGHEVLVANLNKIEPGWLRIFFKYYQMIQVYDEDGEIILKNMHELLFLITDGTK
jgi:hypothetical protein